MASRSAVSAPELAPAARAEIGLPPGTLKYRGKRFTDSVEIALIQYDKANVSSFKGTDIKAVLKQVDPDKVNRINVDGLHETAIVEAIGTQFNHHPMLMEDVPVFDHPPKAEESDNMLFVCVKMLSLHPKKHLKLQAEHISFILGPHYLVSYQEKPGDFFDPIRQRIMAGKGRVRSRNADYLLYLLIDIIVDNYYFISESFNNDLIAPETELPEDPTEETLRTITRYKQHLIDMRRVVYPLREAMQPVSRFNLQADDAGIFFNDLNDHLNNISGNIQSQSDMLNGYMDLYISTVSNRMN